MHEYSIVSVYILILYPAQNCIIYLNIPDITNVDEIDQKRGDLQSLSGFLKVILSGEKQIFLGCLSSVKL